MERLIDAARRSPGRELHVHIVEPERPGGGLYSRSAPDYLILNTPCGQHSLYPYPELVEAERLGMGFYDWVVARGYRWHGYECRVSESGEAITPHDFLPRRLMGEYLEWFYDMLVLDAPANVQVSYHKARAVDIEPLDGGGERVYLDRGPSLEVDHVVLTVGHTEYDGSPGDAATPFLRPYPAEAYLDRIRPGEEVAIEGMGLVALDVISSLTVGIGGRFAPDGAGRLRYVPSGREPVLHLFSRSGYPYCAKSVGTADPVGEFRPSICTAEAVANLRQRQLSGAGPAIDARSELLPLVFAEMELRYYTHAARLDQGPEAAKQVHDKMVAAWHAGSFGQARSAHAAKYGDFDAAAHLFVGEGRAYADAADYESEVYGFVGRDIDEALVQGGASPVKTALETLRALRDILRSAIEFKGLALGSHLEFQSYLQGCLARPVTGPPVFRHQQLLALIDAGILRMPFGPAPELTRDGNGRLKVRSTRLGEPFEMTFAHVVRAHLETPSIGRSSSLLLTNLANRGRVRPMMIEGVSVGSIDLSTDFHPVTDQGNEPRIWVFGAVTEGARYFNLYLPSPKSRVRAFVDAEACANAVLQPVPAASFEARRSGRCLRVALVNNMPDGAFADTERQFRDLLGGWSEFDIELRCFSLPGVERGQKVSGTIADGYEELDELWQSPPDALIVTGAEPKRAELTNEPFWPELERLLWWGRSVVPHMFLSCLTAHAALWAFDRLPRCLLPQKCSGVFAQVLDHDHPLLAGVGGLSLPHSRFNEIPVTELEKAGYRVVVESVDGRGWTIAVGQKGECQLLLLQGHPEYGELTLLREYRRDVRRYLSGDQGSYPQLPVGYLDAEGAHALEEAGSVLGTHERDPSLIDAIPFEFAASHVSTHWEVPARTIVGNWLARVALDATRVRALGREGTTSPRPAPLLSGD
jgi:homoserine O-succinyltransferase